MQKKYFKSPQWLRNIKDKSFPWWRIDTIFSEKKYQNIKFVEEGGWHFTNIKKPSEIEKKIKNISAPSRIQFKSFRLKKDRKFNKREKSCVQY